MNQSKKLQITSPANDYVKELVRLRERKGDLARAGKFLVDGRREVERALRCGFALETLLSTAETSLDEIAADVRSVRRVQISDVVFSKISMRASADDVVGVFDQKPIARSSSRKDALRQEGLHIVLEEVEKPGNLGAILRSADAFGVRSVWTVGRSVDVFHPQVIRASLGGVFHVPVYHCSQDEAKTFFADFKQELATDRSAHTQFIAAALSPRARDLTEVSLDRHAIIFMGPEDKGLSPSWLHFCDYHVKIAMDGICDSLNLSVATAIMMQEWRRQNTRIK